MFRTKITIGRGVSIRLATLAALPVLVCALAACESEAEQQADATEDRIAQEADARSPTNGSNSPILASSGRGLWIDRSSACPACLFL